jgi:hypothetical protein
MTLASDTLLENQRDTYGLDGRFFAPNDSSKYYYCNLTIQNDLLEAALNRFAERVDAPLLLTTLILQGYQLFASSADEYCWKWCKKAPASALAAIPFPVKTKFLVDGDEETVRSALQSHGFLG